MKDEHRSFGSFLQANNIICQVNDTDGKVVLEKLMNLLKRHFPELDIEYTRREVESREAIFSTMVAPGLAIPHARIPGLHEPLTAIDSAGEEICPDALRDPGLYAGGLGDLVLRRSDGANH